MIVDIDGNLDDDMMKDDLETLLDDRT